MEDARSGRQPLPESCVTLCHEAMTKLASLVLLAITGRAAGACMRDLWAIAWGRADTARYDQAYTSVCADSSCRATALTFSGALPQVGTCSPNQILSCVCVLIASGFSPSAVTSMTSAGALDVDLFRSILGEGQGDGSCAVLLECFAGSAACAADLVTLCADDSTTCLPTASTGSSPSRSAAREQGTLHRDAANLEQWNANQRKPPRINPANRSAAYDQAYTRVCAEGVF